jgi:two-component system phosphate regulon sensor histidine kinase PhoR
MKAAPTMRWGFRRKLLLATAGLISVALVLVDVFLGRSLERDLLARIEADLDVRLALVELSVPKQPPPLDDLAGWDALADRAARAAAVRVSFIATDGRMLGDSDVALADLPRVENHSKREEVVSALASGQGRARRRSTTSPNDRWLLYAAHRADNLGVVVRLALPLTELDQALVRLHWLLLGGSVLALAIAMALSVVTAQLFGRLLQVVMVAARRIAEGDLDVRIRPETRDEIGQLGATLDHLAESLSATLATLREERDRLGRILEAMEEGLLVVGADRQISMANPAAKVLLLSAASSSTDAEARRTHAGAQLEGRSVLEAVRSSELDGIVTRTLDHGQPGTGEVGLDHPRARRLLVRATPLGGKDGQGAVVVLVDVTEIRRLEAMRKDFVANVSHELRTPVTAVRTALETARSVLETSPAEADRFLAIVDRHTERLMLLVRDLLDLSRAESGNLALGLEPVAVAEVVGEVFEVFHEPALRRRIKLERALGGDLPLALADRGALVQVLTNLVENAVKYTDEGGTVTVRTRSEPGGAMIAIDVQDSGPGIAAKHLPRLFERFDPGRSRDRGGTGLGLSIVKHLAEAMRGSVAVESQPGRGSRFTVRIPASRLGVVAGGRTAGNAS